MKKLAGVGLALSLLCGGTAAQAFQTPGQVVRHDRQVVRHDRRVVRHERVAARRWSQGQRLPAGYFGPQYYVNDWQARRLPAPRAGYRWIRRDNEYLMIAATTGLIATAIAASN